MSKFECKLTEDLLPVYIDGKAGRETEKFIKEHLNNCLQCRELYNAMIKDIKVPESPIVIKKKILSPKQKMWRFAGIYCVVFTLLIILISTILIWGV